MTYCIFTDLRHFNVKSGNDETLGRVHDIYLDDETWAIKWFVVETGHWYSSNKVLLESKYVTDVSPANRTFHVSIGKDDIENAPSVEEHHPVSEQQDNTFFYTTFGHDTLLFPGYAGMIMPQTLIERSMKSMDEESRQGRSRSRSRLFRIPTMLTGTCAAPMNFSVTPLLQPTALSDRLSTSLSIRVGRRSH